MCSKKKSAMKNLSPLLVIFILIGCSASSRVVPTGSDTFVSQPMGESRLPGNLVDCGGNLTIISIDRNNCGECGMVCAPGHICYEGYCVLSCEQGQYNCNGRCVNLVDDENNCGGCNMVCVSGQICYKGHCVSCLP